MPNLSHDRPTHNLDGRLPILRAQLLAQRQFRLDQLAGLHHESQLAGDRPLDEISLALTEAAETVLADIETALRHIELGDYGRCQQCHTAEIPLEWLAILPTAAFCPDCLNSQAERS